MKYIRNFAIIAHVDHGKSTLADRFLEIAGVIAPGKHAEQFLDRNPVSRERGITIKLAPVRMTYEYSESGIQYSDEKGNEYRILHTKYYILNLIDTPGHVDFSYEVDRTLSCVEGVILLVDATQGIQAQTIANAYKAIEKNLAIIPVINKIDLPHAQIEETKAELIEFLGVREEELYLVSAKTGEGVESLLKAVIQKVPPPQNPKYQIRNPKGRLTSKQIKNSNFENSNLSRDSSFVLRALIFDSYYDSHRGVIAFIRLFAGEIEKGAKLRLCAQNKDFEAQEVGVFSPDLTPCERLTGGEIGYVITNLKDIHTVRIGDTIVKDKSTVSPLPGYKKVKPMVFASIFPTDPSDYANLKKALEKLYLNDSSLAFSPIYSKALGAGFRCGFLGLLHAEVVCERLEREYGLDLVLTPPQIEYEPSKSQKEVLEPLAKIIIVLPQQYMGAVMKLCKDHRARFVTMDNKNRIILTYEIPMSEMISDFYDNLKSVSSGYASLDWEFLGYKPVLASKMTVLLNGDPVEEFSEVVVADCAYEKAKGLVKRLRDVIPRQQYEVKIQAKYDGKIISSERLAPFRKDVTQKLYGGDRTRKDKLLTRQKKGKKRMKMVGRVEIPKEAFLKLFRKS